MIIERDILKKLDEWKNATDRKPLIVQGARQIGKSWAVEDFGKRYYEHLAVFNFDRKRELAEVFGKTKEPSRLIHELAFFTEVPLLPEKTLLFFDEIQECKEALNASISGRMPPSMTSLRLVRFLELQPSVRKRRRTTIVMKTRLTIPSQ